SPLSFSDDVFLTKTSDTLGQSLPITGGLNGGAVVISPRAPGTNITGHVLRPNGPGVRHATLTITEVDGGTRWVRRRPFRDFTFEGVDPDRAYVIAVQSKRYRFTPRVVQAGDSLSGIDFVAIE